MRLKINVLILLIFIIVQGGVLQADIFDATDQGKVLENAVNNDSGLTYNRFAPYIGVYRHNIDYKQGGKFRESSISPGLKQFDIKKSLIGVLDNPELNRLEINDALRKIQSSPLMTLQYTSPAQMDLYKFVITNANLRLLLRYLQYQDLEDSLKDPLIMLRKQAEMDCLRRSGERNIDQAFMKCLNFNNQPALATLNDINDGSGYMRNQVDIIEALINRIMKKSEDWQEVKDLVPRYLVSPNEMSYVVPQLSINQFFNQEKMRIQVQIEQLIKKIEVNQEIDKEKLKSISSSAIPITEKLIRQYQLLNTDDRIIALVKLASRQAYVKTISIYQKIQDSLMMVLRHPQIEAGLKIYVQLALDEIKVTVTSFEQGQNQLYQTQAHMARLLDQLDEERLKRIAYYNQSEKLYE